MITVFEGMTAKELLEMNANLQKKKNALRKALKEKGVLKKDKTNNFDHYNYFSEAQYKLLFTELLSDNGLELKFSELSYDTFSGSEKQPNGRLPRIEFELFDIDTGYSETTIITGEAMDKGDKAGYKAYTGALKYYLANTFLVATGDDVEKESPSEPINDKEEKKATPKQIEYLLSVYEGENLEKLLATNGITDIKDLPMAKASSIITKLKGRK